MEHQGTDLVEIRGLKLRGRHGATSEERKSEQPFIVSLAARLDARPAAMLDDLGSTLDYEEAVRIISKPWRIASRGPSSSIRACSTCGCAWRRRRRRFLKRWTKWPSK
jgi:hypothetical protein